MDFSRHKKKKFGEEEEKFVEAVGEAEVCPKTFSFLGLMGMLAWRIIPPFEFPFNFPVFFDTVS